MKRTLNSALILFSLLAIVLAVACSKDNSNPADEYITWYMTDNNGTLSNPPDSLSMYRWSNETAIYGMSQSGIAYFEITFSGAQSPGVYPASSFLVRVNGKYFVPTASPVQVTVQTYGNAGDYLFGTYVGTAKDSTTSTSVAVRGTFRIKNK